MNKIRYITQLLPTLLFLGAFLMLLLLGGRLFTGGMVDQSADGAVQDLPLQLGDYLTVEYIDVLSRTKSPMTAGKNSDSRQYIRVYFNVKEKKIRFSLMGNFHEGLGWIVTDTSLNVLWDDLGKLKVLTPSEFSITLDGKTLIYRHVGNLKQFVARNTIVGKYKDVRGGLYTFTKEGQAIFPDRSFRYEVPTDIMLGFDQFYEIPERREGIQYGFKVVNKELQLFNIVGEFVDEPEPKPFVTLTRIGDAENKP